MSAAKLLSCSQCNSPVSSEVAVCPKCKSNWFSYEFSCYCCGKPIKKVDAIEEKAFETDCIDVTKIDRNIQEFSYGVQCVNPSEWQQQRFSVDSNRWHDIYEYDVYEFTSDGHLIKGKAHNSKIGPGDSKIGPGANYFRLYHKECHQIISRFRSKLSGEKYTHIVECSLCKAVNQFSSSSHIASIECRNCGHPCKSTKSKLGGFSCSHCDFPLDETDSSTLKLNQLGSNIYVHEICYPDQFKKQREQLISNKLLNNTKRFNEKEKIRIQKKEEDAKLRQRYQSKEQAIRFFELAPLIFAVFVGITSGIGVPHPVFACMYGAFVGCIGWFLSNLICSPIAETIRKSK